MDLGSIPDKIASNADKLGMVVGAWTYLSSLGQGDLMKGAMDIFQGLASHPHIPNLDHVFKNLMVYDYSATFKAEIAAAIGGWFATQVDIHPTITKIGHALMKAGIGAAEASTVLALLAFSGAYYSDGADAGLGGGSHFGFLSGSRHNPHGAYTMESVAPYGTRLTRSGAGSPSPY